MSKIKLFAGNATPELAYNIAGHLYTSLGDVTIRRFSDGELYVQINENVRGCDVFVIQSTCTPANDNLMELVLMIDALRRASAGRVTAVIPYFGYARQDCRVRSARVPITAKVVADILTNAGADRILTVDLHADQVQGFFDLPVDNIFGSSALLGDSLTERLSSPVVVSPDMGSVVRARAIAKMLGDTDIAIIDKRDSSIYSSLEFNLIGDVTDRDCIIVDDLCDTAETLCQASEVIKRGGANRIIACVIHPVFSRHAIRNIRASVIDEIIVTDSIPVPSEILMTGRVTVQTLAPILGEAIRRISNDESISSMFVNENNY